MKVKHTLKWFLVGLAGLIDHLIDPSMQRSLVFLTQPDSTSLFMPPVHVSAGGIGSSSWRMRRATSCWVRQTCSLSCRAARRPRCSCRVSCPSSTLWIWAAAPSPCWPRRRTRLRPSETSTPWRARSPTWRASPRCTSLIQTVETIFISSCRHQEEETARRVLWRCS